MQNKIDTALFLFSLVALTWILSIIWHQTGGPA